MRRFSFSNKKENKKINITVKNKEQSIEIENQFNKTISKKRLLRPNSYYKNKIRIIPYLVPIDKEKLKKKLFTKKKKQLEVKISNNINIKPVINKNYIININNNCHYHIQIDNVNKIKKRKLNFCKLDIQGGNHKSSLIDKSRSSFMHYNYYLNTKDNNDIKLKEKNNIYCYKELESNSDKRNTSRKKKLHIDPENFKIFCEEINKKLKI